MNPEEGTPFSKRRRPMVGSHLDPSTSEHLHLLAVCREVSVSSIVRDVLIKILQQTDTIEELTDNLALTISRTWQQMVMKNTTVKYGQYQSDIRDNLLKKGISNSRISIILRRATEIRNGKKKITGRAD
jgi:hypothetical protein